MKQKILAALMIGGIVGALFGALESMVWLVQIPWWTIDAPVMGVSMLLYGFLGAAITAFWAIWVPPAVSAIAYQKKMILFSVTALVYLIAGFYINLFCFPKITSVKSIIFTGIWTLLWLFVAVRLLRTSSGESLDASDRIGFKKLPAITFALMVVIGLSFLPLGSLNRYLRHLVSPDPSGKIQKPNILLIIMDTTRADRLSSYGNPRLTTPHVDELAKEGVLFEKAYSTAPWTLPSHASLFSGLLPSQHGAQWAHQYLDDSITTLAERLREKGYQTAGFSNNPWISRATNFDQGFDYYEETWLLGRLVNRLAVVKIINKLTEISTRSRDDDARLTNLDVNRWFKDLYTPSKPFFMFINYIEPHYSYEPPEPYRKRFLQDKNKKAARGINPEFLKSLAPPMHLDESLRAALNDLYEGEIAYLDMRLGKLFQILKNRKVYDNTVIIITSDHGEEIGDHHNFEHQFGVYDTLLHIPLIVRYPALFPQGKRVETPVSLIDVVPTLIQIAGMESAPEDALLTGKSLLESINITDGIKREILSEYDAPLPRLDKFREKTTGLDESYFKRSLKGFRRGAFKLIWASDGRHELYNLRKDPAESRNLFERFPHYSRGLEGRLTQMLDRLPAVTLSKPGGKSIDSKTLEQIRSLGYV